MSNPIALVTGGSIGIGRSICEHLLGAGYTVVNLSLTKSELRHPALIDHPVDLTDLPATAAAVKTLADEHEITTLVHNAGVIRPALIEDVQLQDVEHLTQLHVQSPIVLLQGVLPAMKRAQFGRVVVISSRAALGLETRTAYATTKAGQLGMVRTWALELGQHGITVNAIAPGPIVTDMFTRVVPEHSDKARAIAQSIPVKRLGQPGDIAHTTLFLVSPDSGFITGQCLFVCGGASLGSLAL